MDPRNRVTGNSKDRGTSHLTPPGKCTQQNQHSRELPERQTSFFNKFQDKKETMKVESILKENEETYKPITMRGHYLNPNSNQQTVMKKKRDNWKLDH